MYDAVFGRNGRLENGAYDISLWIMHIWWIAADCARPSGFDYKNCLKALGVSLKYGPPPTYNVMMKYLARTGDNRIFLNIFLSEMAYHKEVHSTSLLIMIQGEHLGTGAGTGSTKQAKSTWEKRSYWQWTGVLGRQHLSCFPWHSLH